MTVRRSLVPFVAAAVLLSGCSSASDNGGSFAFHSPGGQVELFYPQEERKWCAPCRAEVDDLQEVQESIEGFGTVLGINVRDHNADIARDFMKDNGVTYPSIYDPPFKTAAFLGGVPSSVIPTTIVLDTQRRPAAVFLREVNAQEIIDLANTLHQEAEA